MKETGRPQQRLTTLPLARGTRPFALSEDERHHNGDWWAWQFLRRNPFYRRDFVLSQAMPDIAHWHANNPLATLQGKPPKPLPNAVTELDARYFCMHGNILSGPVEWPEVGPYPLSAYRLEHPEVQDSDIYLREFDSATTYGIAHWFNPDEAELPMLADGQSWFFCLTEPIWRVGDVDWRANTVEASVTGYGRTVVGLNTDQPIVRKAWTHFSLAAQVSADGKTTYTEVSADKPARPLFLSSDSEMAFAVSLDLDIHAQLRPIKALASSYQKQLRALGELSRSVTPPVGIRPVVMHPEQGHAQTIDFLRGLVQSPQRLHHQPVQHWRAALVDTRYTLGPQFDALMQEFKGQQDQLGALKVTPPSRVRNAGTEDFWLKKALTMLELQCSLPGAKKNTPAGAALIAQAIYEPTHPLHTLARPDSGLNKDTYAEGNDATLWNSDGFKDSLKNAKETALSKYLLLVGRPAKDLYKHNQD